MIKDNWSLKGRKKTVDTKFYENKPQRGVTTVDVYLKEDIEILKNKLIEDFEEVNDWLILPTDSIDLDRIKKIIDKRFGVK